MDRIKPYQKIASRFQVSQESAKYFLNRVQKSFKQERPSHALILGIIEEQGLDSLPEPYDVAVMMHESGVWTYALNSPPALLVDEG